MNCGDIHLIPDSSSSSSSVNGQEEDSSASSSIGGSQGRGQTNSSPDGHRQYKRKSLIVGNSDEGTNFTDSITSGGKSSGGIDMETLEKPKRPLSAYNFFLKEERKKIILGVMSDTEKSNEDNSDADTNSKHPPKKRRLSDSYNLSPSDNSSESSSSETSDEDESLNSSTMSFGEIGQIIGKRWHEVKTNPELLARYEKLAKEDNKRFIEEMEAYKEKRKEMILSATKSNKASSAHSKPDDISLSRSSPFSASSKPTKTNQNDALLHQKLMVNKTFPPMDLQALLACSQAKPLDRNQMNPAAANITDTNVAMPLSISERLLHFQSQGTMGQQQPFLENMSKYYQQLDQTKALISRLQLPQQPTQEKFPMGALSPLDTFLNQHLESIGCNQQVQVPQAQQPQHALDYRLLELLQVEEQHKALLGGAQPSQQLPQVNQHPVSLPPGVEPSLQQQISFLEQQQQAQQVNPISSLLTPAAVPAPSQQMPQQLLQQLSMQHQLEQMQKVMPQQAVQQLMHQMGVQKALEVVSSQQPQHISPQQIIQQLT